MTPAREVVLEARGLVVEYETSHGRVRSLDSASLRVHSGDLVALVGESGSGKSTLGMAAGGLLASNARCLEGEFDVLGVDPLRASPSELRRLRREGLGFIFQNPVAALNPTMKVRRQMQLASEGRPSQAALESSLSEMGLDDTDRVLASFPHELSGGMAQRVGIAIALRRHPKLLIADEPTAAVDATGRERILRLLIDRCRQTGCALLLLTHDLHAVRKQATHVAVMYGGRVVESGLAGDVLDNPLHPYTDALLSALPGEERPGERLDPIWGTPPVLLGPSRGCAFFERCPKAMPVCRDARPSEFVPPWREDGMAVCHLLPDGLLPDGTEAAVRSGEG